MHQIVNKVEVIEKFTIVRLGMFRFCLPRNINNYKKKSQIELGRQGTERSSIIC